MLKPFAFVLPALALASCAGNDNPFEVTRSACPAPAVLQNAGDVTLFSTPGSRDADAIDVTATITNLRADCGETLGSIVSTARFDVVAQRRDTSAAREVTLPYFAAVVRAGDQLVAKQAGQVTLRFAAGQARASAPATARADVARSAATLPTDIRERITRKRKPGDADAAIDPLADPQVREAVRTATFELLVGFQLDPSALAYNVGR